MLFAARASIREVTSVRDPHHTGKRGIKRRGGVSGQSRFQGGHYRTMRTNPAANINSSTSNAPIALNILFAARAAMYAKQRPINYGVITNTNRISSRLCGGMYGPKPLGAAYGIAAQTRATKAERAARFGGVGLVGTGCGGRLPLKIAMTNPARRRIISAIPGNSPIQPSLSAFHPPRVASNI